MVSISHTQVRLQIAVPENFKYDLAIDLELHARHLGNVKTLIHHLESLPQFPPHHHIHSFTSIQTTDWTEVGSNLLRALDRVWLEEKRAIVRVRVYPDEDNSNQEDGGAVAGEGDMNFISSDLEQALKHSCVVDTPRSRQGVHQGLHPSIVFYQNTTSGVSLNTNTKSSPSAAVVAPLSTPLSSGNNRNTTLHHFTAVPTPNSSPSSISIQTERDSANPECLRRISDFARQVTERAAAQGFVPLRKPSVNK